MQKVIGGEIKTLTRVPAETAVPLFEPGQETDSPVDGLLAEIDDMVTGLGKRKCPQAVSVPAADREALVSEINEAAHRYDGSAGTGQQERVHVRSLNIF